MNAKAELRKKRQEEANREFREVTLVRFKCFWTWPFGHEYGIVLGEEGAENCCVGCGKPFPENY